MAHFRFSSNPISFATGCKTTVFCFMLLFLYLPFSAGQDISSDTEGEKTSELDPATEPLKIKLSVNEIRMDVVVLDKKGEQITNLTAADFEVYQNDKRQNVLSSVYIGSQSDGQSEPRTIVFVFDDCAMSFANVHYAKMALRKFVENQMQPGDLVAVYNTGFGNNELIRFLSDKRQLLERINAIPAPLGPRGSDCSCFALDYSIRALRDMPGRKILINITPDVTVDPKDFHIYNLLADNALRSGVVINYLDINGLEANDTNLDWNNIVLTSATYAGGQHALRFSINDALRSSRNRALLNPLPAKTGGVLIQDSNFFLNGIGKKTENLLKGYYLVTYSPPESTFKPDSKEKKYQWTKINVKRRGAVVHARDGFYNRIDGETDGTPANPLIDAIYSPFRYAGLDVNMVAGYVKDARAGYLVRTWMHIASDDVKIIETEDGGALIDLEMVCLTSDVKGDIRDSRHVKYTFTVKPENRTETIAWIGKHGIRFSTLLPVQKPGPYYARVSVKDTGSDKVGSAYQFVEIPDLKQNGLALSNMFMITSMEDLEWMRSDVTKDLSQASYSPVFQPEEVRSPALRTYAPGDNLLIMTVLYNADAKAVARSEIETQTVLYKDGKEFHRGTPVTITPDDMDDSDSSVQIVQRITLDSDMLPGDYVLQLIATDKKNSRKQEGVASQTLGFTVVAE
jgi:VWFA-related protein